MNLSAMPCRVTQDRWVIVKNSDKTWSTGGENGNPLQYSCHENTMNSMKRQKDITPEDESHRSKSETESLSVKSVSLQLMDCSPSTASVHEIFQQEYLSGLPNLGPLEKAMATHSSTLAWRIPWMEEPDRLQSMGLLRVGHD